MIAEASGSGADRHVLVIDDDEGECCLVEDILSMDGIEVEKAVGGEEGIRLLSKKSFPVVITDLRMPDIDGFAIADFIRKHEINSLVIVITGFGSIDTVIEALRIGAYDYIIKPFSANLMRLTVKRAFDYIELCKGKERASHAEAITQLAQTTAHEIFQPLTLVMGRVNEISKCTEDEKIKDLAGKVLDDARKIKDIVRRIDNLNDYVTKSLPGGHTILDIEKTSSDHE